MTGLLIEIDKTIRERSSTSINFLIFSTETTRWSTCSTELGESASCGALKGRRPNICVTCRSRGGGHDVVRPLLGRDGGRGLGGGVGDDLVAADHAGQPQPDAAAHLVPPLLPPAAAGRALGPLRPHEVVGERAGVLVTGRVPHPLYLSPVVQHEGVAGQAAPLGCRVGAGPVLGLHAAPAGHQVLPGLRVDTVTLDGGPGRPLAVHSDDALHYWAQGGQGHQAQEPGRQHGDGCDGSASPEHPHGDY